MKFLGLLLVAGLVPFATAVIPGVEFLYSRGNCHWETGLTGLDEWKLDSYSPANAMNGAACWIEGNIYKGSGFHAQLLDTHTMDAGDKFVVKLNGANVKEFTPAEMVAGQTIRVDDDAKFEVLYMKHFDSTSYSPFYVMNFAPLEAEEEEVAEEEPEDVPDPSADQDVRIVVGGPDCKKIGLVDDDTGNDYGHNCVEFTRNKNNNDCKFRAKKGAKMDFFDFEIYGKDYFVIQGADGLNSKYTTANQPEDGMTTNGSEMWFKAQNRWFFNRSKGFTVCFW